MLLEVDDMKRLISTVSAAALALTLAVPAVCAATETEAVRSGVHKENFNVELATVLIVTVCAVLAAALTVVCVILARRNRNN